MFRKGFLILKISVIVISIIGAFCPNSSGTLPSDFEMYNSYFDPFVIMGFDAAGYSDWMYWGNNGVRHTYYPTHEMLWGEWAAAIYYDVIAGQKAMWLTNYSNLDKKISFVYSLS
jgi:hypothetical protein